MNNQLKLKRKKVELRKHEFDNAVSNNEKGDKLLEKSIKLDNAISDFLKETLKHEDENKKFIGKYKDILDRDYKNEILDMIKKDVINKTKSLTKEEIEQFSNNVYVYATLKVYNIDEQDAIRQVMYRNNLFISSMEEQGIKLSDDLSDLDLKFIQKMIKKYVKIIKERI